MPTAPVPGGPPPVTRAVPSTASSGAPTGRQTDADIAAAVDDELATLTDLPLAEHPQVYARLHGTLTDALAATVDQGR
ncbi:hypothetical protein JL107_17450 [Nakamurella flavida]|uniref:Uncharacterized protein n=1 Tax=Nakamurella flavida TaxID=363630 RepID=A0A938YLK2_9ACTN|nr:hypothetical protein [Nakamurella flavida]MBM9478237.1 hypothetical protein [Nakamurella flavida]MDP9777593.1 hypothetical protein [Nakamurella flavida]